MSPKHQEEKDTEENGVDDSVGLVPIWMVVVCEFEVPNAVDKSDAVKVCKENVSQGDHSYSLLVTDTALPSSLDHFIFIAD